MVQQSGSPRLSRSRTQVGVVELKLGDALDCFAPRFKGL